MALGEDLAEESMDLWLGELALEPRMFAWTDRPDPERLNDFSVTVIGSGLGGLNVAVQLKCDT
jgi:4-hydroxyacetophenone monooxygenase